MPTKNVSYTIFTGVFVSLNAPVIRAVNFAVLSLVVILGFGTSVSVGAPDEAGVSELPLASSPCRVIPAAMDFTELLDAPTQITDVKAVKAASGLPNYCQIQGNVVPSTGIKVGLPSPWNGKFIEMGCGSYCGTLEYFESSCGIALRRGYACIVSDMGHETGGTHALWAYNNLPAKFDWGYRSAHVAALFGKALVERYYQKPISKSYFMGSSNGGRQALQEAQHFPLDFDGIIAIAPPVNLATVFMKFAWGYLALHDDRGTPLLGMHELKLLTDAAVAKCDMDDGVKDGVIGDPLHCAFDPEELSCGAHNAGECLTSSQVDAARKVYAGPMTSKGKRLTLGGPLVGTEFGQAGNDASGWRFVYLGIDKGELADYNDFATDGFRYLFFWPDAGPTWKLSDLDFDRDSNRMGMMEALYDCGNPDLRPFRSGGGKLLLFQGLSDVRVPPEEIIDYYQTLERVMGGGVETQKFARLFLLPGVGHFEDGPGAATLDYLTALENWVEKNIVPDRLIAAHMKDESSPGAPTRVQFTRPVYPYPFVVHYKGRGDPNVAASFAELHR